MTASGIPEAKYVALSKVVKEVLFLRQLQEFMEPSMRVGAVNVFEDNEGARTVDKAVDSTWKHTRTWTSEPAWIRDDQFRVR